GQLQTAWTRLKDLHLAEIAGLVNQPQAPRQNTTSGGGGNRGPLPVEVAAAMPAQLSDDILAIGTLLPDESVDIAAETSGRVKEILFKDGQTVEASAVLFKFDDDLIRAVLDEAQARLELAEANFKRNQTLKKSGNVSQST